MSFFAKTVRSLKKSTASLSIKLNTFKTKLYLRVKGIKVNCKNVSFEGTVKLAIADSATVTFAEGVRLANCFIEVGEDSEVLIEQGCAIQGLHIKVFNCSILHLHENVLVERVQPSFPFLFSIMPSLRLVKVRGFAAQFKPSTAES